MKRLFIICFLAVPGFCFSQNQNLSKEILKRAEQENSNGDFEKAILDYSKVIELTPNDPWWWMARGEVRFKNKDTIGALADLNKSIQIDSGFSYGYFRRGYIKAQIGDKKGSDWDFNKSDDLKHPFFDKARLEQKGGDYKAALQNFLIALSLHPKDADIYFDLALTERALKEDFNADIYFNKATDFYKSYK